MSASRLHPRLRALVGAVEAELGAVVREAAGPEVYRAVEAVRRHMVAFRSSRGVKRERALAAADRVLRALPARRRAGVARAYTLYLELVNVCENAWRTHRLRGAPAACPPDAKADVVFVLTAHPTESRSPENIRALRKLQRRLVEDLDAGRPPRRGELAHFLHVAWRVGSHVKAKPAVEDEARHLFSLLTDRVLEELLDLAARGHRVRLRTWVGGDKDGHPGVGPAQTRASLNLSRQRLLAFVRRRILPDLRDDLGLLPSAALTRSLRALELRLRAAETVRPGDGARMRRVDRAAAALDARYRAERGRRHPRLEVLAVLLQEFPSLVVPLELREEAGRFGPRSTIAAMARRVEAIARGGEVAHYVRGVVVSMASEPEHLLAPLRLTRKIPVIPLFETPRDLERATTVLDAAWKAPLFRRAVRARRGRQEVMLGYSDTAKRMGAMPSRLAIHAAMRRIETWAQKRRITPVFFQGSGGSVGRGGGRYEDMAQTWTPSATALVKMTLQGEMVERSFASRAILRRQVEKLAAIQSRPPRTRRPGAVATALAARAAVVFAATVKDPAFLDLLAAATPYQRLSTLRIGSRPSKRKASGGLDSLRAIPWVLCWTQTRYLLPVWLGLGTAFREFKKTRGWRRRFSAGLRADPFLRSHLRLLGFTLAKTEPRLWKEYLRRLAPDADPRMTRFLDREYRDALALAKLGGGGRLLGDRPWLQESIYFRAPMIHPLNLMQIALLEKAVWNAAEADLFRESVTGVAAGMLTTG